MSFGARALIRLGALKHNLGIIRIAAPDARVMAVIKANAYGHGMVTVARHLTDVDSFAVARLPEALALRDAGIDKPVVLLAGVMTDEGRRTAFEHGFERDAQQPQFPLSSHHLPVRLASAATRCSFTPGRSCCSF